MNGEIGAVRGIRYSEPWTSFSKRVRHLETIRKHAQSHAIAQADKAFTVSIYHPPSLEERSQMMQRRHMWRIAP
jgi:hypothetical protein